MGEEMRVVYELKCEQRFGEGGVGAFGGDGIVLNDVLGALGGLGGLLAVFWGCWGRFNWYWGF